MEKTEILAICSHEGILATMIRLIKNNEAWDAAGAADVNEAIDLIDNQRFDLILLGSGISEEDENRLYEHSKTVPVVRHYGGGSGLLFGEIYEALNANNAMN